MMHSIDSHSGGKKINYILLILFLLLGLSLRMHNLGTASLWFDEAKSVIYHCEHFATLLTGMLRENHPTPLYEAFMHFWIYLGTGEAMLRFSSVIFSILSMVVIFYLGRILYTHPKYTTGLEQRDRA